MYCIYGAGGAQVPRSAEELAAGQTDFIYLGGAPTASGTGVDRAMICTRPGILPDGAMVVAYADGRVFTYDAPPPGLFARIMAARARQSSPAGP